LFTKKLIKHQPHVCACVTCPLKNGRFIACTITVVMPSPSPEDVSVTRQIVQAGKLLGIDLLDHLIICNGIFASLKEQGLGALWDD
jgi:hypothetical protein